MRTNTGSIAWFRGSRAFVLLAVALSAGCYESGFPLDPAPVVDVDDALLGTWRCLPLDGDADEQPATVTVDRARDRKYRIVWQETGSDPENYEAFASNLRGARLFNVREPKRDGSAGTWVFVRPTLLKANILQIQIVADKALAKVQKSPPAIRAAIERQRSDPALYVDGIVCARAGGPK